MKDGLVQTGDLPPWQEPGDIKDAVAVIAQLGRNMHEHAYLVGRTLLWVKKEVGHGKFMPWLHANVWFGERTAAYMMQFAARCQKNATVLEYHPDRIKSAIIANLPPSGLTTCEVSDLIDLANSGKKFGTIYADPPWEYDNRATRSAVQGVYKLNADGRNTMTPDEVAAMPIEKLAADQSHLHLWTTNAFLFDCKQIIEAWGFEYKSAFVWIKPQMGIGNYWRVSHEFLLLGVRGGLTFADHGLMSWLLSDRGEHSSKPDRVRWLIERASPSPRIELFARRLSEGWAAWGNEIERDMFTREVAAL